MSVSSDPYNIQLTNSLYTRIERQSEIKVKSCNALLRVVLVAPSISSEVPYKFLIFDA